jgi:hypothetical protein
MTSITKGNGHQLAVRWGWWHVEMMLAAAGGKSIFEKGLWPHTMQYDFSVCDVSDREELTIKKGWVLDMWRS